MHKKIKSLIWLGAAIIILSFAGIPDSWKMPVYVFIGIAIIAIALSLRKFSNISSDSSFSPTEKPYSENSNYISKIGVKSEGYEEA